MDDASAQRVADARPSSPWASSSFSKIRLQSTLSPGFTGPGNG